MAVTEVDAQQLAMRVRQSTMRLRRRLRRESPSGLSQSDFSALSSIIREGRIGLGELAALEGIKPPSMTRIASGLERDGLVSRHADPEDRRRAWLEATSAGRRLVEHNRRQRDAYLAAIVASLTPDEQRALDGGVAVLERLLELPA